MKLDRRKLLLSGLVGAGSLGLRALATGLPPSFLLAPRRALASGAADCPANRGQFVIFCTSGNGDPLNANVPGTYEDPNIVHGPDPSIAPVKLSLAGKAVTAAAPWSTLPQAVLDRTCFFHLMTNTPVHPKEPDVLKLMDDIAGGEMLPSLLARELATCLGTIQSQPISLGASSPSEGLTFGGQALPIIPALALKATLTSPAGPLTDLQSLRDQTLDELYDLYKNEATAAQRAYIDAFVTSQNQVRSLKQELLEQLASIEDNSIGSQVIAALTLVQMKVTPVIAVHVPFGGDNHRDVGLATEAAETVSGVAAIADLLKRLDAAGLADQVLFASLNVFGRTLGPGNTDGRQHNDRHQVSLLIGKPIRGGVIGGVAPAGKDYGALPIDSKSGAGAASGDISALETLPSFAKTLGVAAGVNPATLDDQIGGGTAVPGALAT